MDGRGSFPPREWGILFVLSLAKDKTIHGRVRLNKALALLQCNGFPIPNRFVNMKMGPADSAIAEDASNLQHEHLISIEEKPVIHGNDLNIYRMNDDGLNYFQSNYSSIIEHLPYQRILKARAEEIMRDLEIYFKTGEIVDKVHKELFINDIENFEEIAKDDLNRLDEIFFSTHEKWDDRCPICLELAGTTEYATKSLEIIIERELEKRESGKNMILYNTRDLLNWADKLRQHTHITDVRFGNDQISQFRELLGHRLFCIESLSELYGIKPPEDEIDLTEDPQGIKS